MVTPGQMLLLSGIKRRGGRDEGKGKKMVREEERDKVGERKKEGEGWAVWSKRGVF